MPVSPEELEWVKLNCRIFKVPVPGIIDDNSTHDIAFDGQNILLGRVYNSEKPDSFIHKQKLTHELLHGVGLDHDQKARNAGYYSKPERDKFSRSVAKMIMNPELSLREKRFINNRFFSVDDPYFWENTEADLRSYRFKNESTIRHTIQKMYNEYKKTGKVNYLEEKNPLILSGIQGAARGLYEARVPEELRIARADVQAAKSALQGIDAQIIAARRHYERQPNSVNKTRYNSLVQKKRELLSDIEEAKDNLAGQSGTTSWLRQNPLVIPHEQRPEMFQGQKVSKESFTFLLHTYGYPSTKILYNQYLNSAFDDPLEFIKYTSKRQNPRTSKYTLMDMSQGGQLVGEMSLMAYGDESAHLNPIRKYTGIIAVLALVALKWINR